ncbi:MULTISPECIES: hypothetical protein [Caballeronia]|uniref:hypothetical protein n=1 Tax=Caballeronia TaxID=1827195 RepID=UPI00158C6A4A|nr:MULTISPECIES: hypothetical protein [Caballeronia]MCG7401021.1 hypothetical protein [Caballeronia zhejiangensis]MCI1046323.1 hypothetical protein [Caballeronia zhejiangensis]
MGGFEGARAHFAAGLIAGDSRFRTSAHSRRAEIDAAVSAGHALANFLLAVEFAEVREEFVAVDVVSAIDLRMPDGKDIQERVRYLRGRAALRRFALKIDRRFHGVGYVHGQFSQGMNNRISTIFSPVATRFRPKSPDSPPKHHKKIPYS